MTASARISYAGTLAQGVVHSQYDRLAGRLDESTQAFKAAAAERIESLAGQIRDLGHQFERPDEAHGIARSLEKTADYIRFRPAANVAGDAWQVTKKYHLLWLTGGLLAAVIAYRMTRQSASEPNG